MFGTFPRVAQEGLNEISLIFTTMFTMISVLLLIYIRSNLCTYLFFYTPWNSVKYYKTSIYVIPLLLTLDDKHQAALIQINKQLTFLNKYTKTLLKI